MILKTCLLLVLSVACGVSGVSYSNVFVQTGPELAPAVEYYGGYPYNLEYASPKIAQYKSSVKYEYPIGSNSYSYRTATVSEPVAAVATPAAAPAPDSSMIYPSYATPVSNLYGARNEPNAFEYVYYYLPNTGAELRQLNEGEAYRGGYTFLQPEGLVKYVTDNNLGFNAIFKNYLPGGEVKPTESAPNAAPCNEGKSAALTAPEEAAEEQEARRGGNEAVEPNEPSEHEHNIIIKIQEGRDSENDEPVVEIEHHVHSHAEEQSEPKESTESEEKPAQESEQLARTHEKIMEDQKTAVAVAPEYPVAGNNVFISYNDFIKCLQTALARGSTQPFYAPVPKPVSPLTYLIYNKPC